MSTDEFQEFVADQLAGLDRLLIKRMFGAAGLYLDGVFFGILDDGRLYFKTNESTRVKYLAAESGPFTYEKKRKSRGTAQKVALKNYYEVPTETLENPRELQRWAREAASLEIKKGSHPI